MVVLANFLQHYIQKEVSDPFLREYSNLPVLRPQIYLLWIDALCIDQKNNSERNHHFTQISRFFSGGQSQHMAGRDLEAGANTQIL